MLSFKYFHGKKRLHHTKYCIYICIYDNIICIVLHFCIYIYIYSISVSYIVPPFWNYLPLTSLSHYSFLYNQTYILNLTLCFVFSCNIILFCYMFVIILVLVIVQLCYCSCFVICYCSYVCVTLLIVNLCEL